MTSADDTGMGKGLSQIILPQIRVGIKMYDTDIRVFFIYFPECAEGDQMLPAYHERHLAVL